MSAKTIEVRTLNYCSEVGGGSYTISKHVTLPKKTECLRLKIEDWSNARYLYVDKKNNLSYFQASSESNDCHRCSICQRRMKLVGWKTGHDFVEINTNYSLYQELKDVPENSTSEAVSKFLGLKVVN